MADVKPIGPWPVAQYSDIINPDHFNVPILWVPWTPATVHITHNEFPLGVVILNENPPDPPDDHIIHTGINGNQDLQIVNNPNPAGEDVNIPDNVGWPCGRIILW